jgi:choline kinase
MCTSGTEVRCEQFRSITSKGTAAMAESVQTPKAIILSAGQGSRLLPMTENIPKCLLGMGGRNMLEWQLRGLAAADVREVVVVTGFHAELIERTIEDVAPAHMRVRTLFNPFYKVADNLASCWMARSELDSPALILNGDTLFEPEIAKRLLAAPCAPITVTIDRKPTYDADDMKVITVGDRLKAIGKRLPLSSVNGESIGFVRFDAVGVAAFVNELERTMRTPEGVGLWYLSAIHRLANAHTDVRVASIEGLVWSEMDFPADLARCREITNAWAAKEGRSITQPVN